MVEFGIWGSRFVVNLRGRDLTLWARAASLFKVCDFLFFSSCGAYGCVDDNRLVFEYLMKLWIGCKIHMNMGSSIVNNRGPWWESARCLLSVESCQVLHTYVNEQWTFCTHRHMNNTLSMLWWDNGGSVENTVECCSGYWPHCRLEQQLPLQRQFHLQSCWKHCSPVENTIDWKNNSRCSGSSIYNAVCWKHCSLVENIVVQLKILKIARTTPAAAAVPSTVL